MLIWVVMQPLGHFSKSEGRETVPEGHILRVVALTRTTGPSSGCSCLLGGGTSLVRVAHLLEVAFSPGETASQGLTQF